MKAARTAWKHSARAEILVSSHGTACFATPVCLTGVSQNIDTSSTRANRAATRRWAPATASTADSLHRLAHLELHRLLALNTGSSRDVKKLT